MIRPISVFSSLLIIVLSCWSSSRDSGDDAHTIAFEPLANYRRSLELNSDKQGAMRVLEEAGETVP